MMDRRHFLSLAATAGSALGLPRALRGAPPFRTAESLAGLAPVGGQERRYPLRRMPDVRGERLTLTAGTSDADLGPGTSAAWTLNGRHPAPTIHLSRGANAQIVLENELPEPTILHWHGLDVPEAADGHPRLAIGPGESYHYDFTVRDRAGLYWYHPHTHERTAPQTYQGMAGLLVVEDEEEASLGLPDGEHELPLILQDKRLGDGTSLAYRPSMGPDRMLGYLGDTPVANGIAHATTTVRRGRYRLRLLNASNARIFNLGLSSGAPLTLVGTDGGLLERPIGVDRILLGTGERADVLVDFSHLEPGERVFLRSFEFRVPGMMGMGRGMMGGRGMGPGGRGRSVPPQGAAMDLLELVASDAPVEAPPEPLPERLSTIAPPNVDGSTPRRTFRFDSRMMRHTINGRSFGMERVDLRIPRGRTEIWAIENGSALPHPVHIHVGQFHVLSRSGGRARIMPWETGLKDTVLVFPSERVEVAVRFEEHPGLFLMHCHNLEHEDMGMMLNFEVE
ncbi:MAG: multicopper oxidase domain-containing protein [Gemmatimonadota bacterium]|nr:multicopper oxidase domain-containing protein [Gemmatimonadota bacterium]